MPRVVHFEISADDTARAKTFYQTVFGWSFSKYEGSDVDYHLVQTGEGMGIDGGMFQRQGPMTGHVNTIDVPDIDEYIEKVKAAGGEIVFDKHEIPGVGWHAYFKDSEGSLVGMIQMTHPQQTA